MAAASCVASRACRSCSREGVVQGIVAATVPPTVAAPLLEAWIATILQAGKEGDGRDGLNLARSRILKVHHNIGFESTFTRSKKESPFALLSVLERQLRSTPAGAGAVSTSKG